MTISIVFLLHNNEIIIIEAYVNGCGIYFFSLTGAKLAS